jgi:phosphoglycerate dehydrogenase-like enzyme
MKRVVSLFGEKTPEFEALNREAAEYAAKLGMEYEWAPQAPWKQDAVVSCLKHADAGIIDVELYDEAIFRKINRSCRLLTRFGVGYDKVDLKAASKYGIAIARTTGANTLAVAESAFSLAMAARRLLKRYDRAVEQGDWTKVIMEETIGATIGIVGFGGIGRALARLFSGWNCAILTYDPFPNQKFLDEYHARSVSLEELFKAADVISLHVPYSKETDHFIDGRLISLMKPDAVLVNTARGNIVDEDALAKALRERRIGGAGFDVFGREPLPVSSPLVGLDNVVLTPHVSSQTRQSLRRIYRMALDITADFFAGRGSPHILNQDYVSKKNA